MGRQSQSLSPQFLVPSPHAVFDYCCPCPTIQYSSYNNPKSLSYFPLTKSPLKPPMEVVIPSPSMDFDFNTARPSPYATSPSTPRRFGDYQYFSAPASPTHVSLFYRDFNEFVTAAAAAGDPSSVPFESEDDFAFDFKVDPEKKSLSAEELFDGGVIRPLKLPPCLQPPMLISPGSAVSSPRQRRRRQSDVRINPFEAAIENMRKQSQAGSRGEVERERGRERITSSGSGRKTARSYSPMRVSAYPWEEDDRRQLATSAKQKSSSSSLKKWSIKDLLLFRSASEGSVTDKNHLLRKYSGIFRRQEEVKNSSFRSDDSSGSISRRRGRVSAHELLYTANKAASNDLKKKTFLPYKQGILGRLSFNPAVHALSNGFGSLYRHHH